MENQSFRNIQLLVYDNSFKEEIFSVFSYDFHEGRDGIKKKYAGLYNRFIYSAALDMCWYFQ